METVEDRLLALERKLDTLYVAISTDDYSNMPVEQDIKNKCIGRVNFQANKALSLRVAELEFSKLEAKQQELHTKMRLIAEDFPRLKTRLVEEDVPSIYK